MMRLWGLEMIMLGEGEALGRKLEKGGNSRSALARHDYTSEILTARLKSHFLRTAEENVSTSIRHKP